MSSKYSNGFICGVFDSLKHDSVFKECKAQCQKLIVALQVDPTIDRSIKRKPSYSVLERYMYLDNLPEVDKVIPYETEADLTMLLRGLDVDVRFLAVEYKNKFFTGDELDIPIHYIEYK